SVLRQVDTLSAETAASALETAGVEAVAVVFLHAYRNPAHEQEVTALLRSRNGWFVCGSAELSGELREFERTSTTVLNAALMPLIDNYLTRLESGLAAAGSTASLFVTQSNGGALTPAAARVRPVTLALSGPVAGVVACSRLGRAVGTSELICLDMGGTSADVSIISGNQPQMTSELTIGELPVRLPAVHVHSIGAGGGSIASVDIGGALRVGPASAGAEPGPACYGRGGTAPTVTDCQLHLGRLTEDFALAGRLPLDANLARGAIETLAEQLGMTVDDAAAGVIEVVNAAMEGAVRVALRSRGDDPRDFALVAFGGAGPLHAAELAHRLSIDTIIVPPHPGTLSALGLLAADVRLDFSASELHGSREDELATTMLSTYEALARQAQAEMDGDDELRDRSCTHEHSCDVRYAGQAYEVNVPVDLTSLEQRDTAAVFARFHELHQQAYGFASLEDECELVTMRLVVTVPIEKPPLDPVEVASESSVPTSRSVLVPSEGYVDVPIYRRDTLAPGATIDGPAVIHQTDTTTFVPRFAHVLVDELSNLIISIDRADA
ncbi:hydantoinase/oxoprolinase family protein, partial [Gaiella sp.]|uniref:hydantoinase/oxoprolinase family protein n=1 Tax=Gaiella sp. TaxID=2663207 RepID=UPI003264D15B